MSGWPPPLPTFTGDWLGNIVNSLGWLGETSGLLVTQDLSPGTRPPLTTRDTPKANTKDGMVDRVVITGSRDEYGSTTQIAVYLVGALVAAYLVLRNA